MKKMWASAFLCAMILGFVSCVDGPFPWKEKGYKSPMLMISEDRYDFFSEKLEEYFAAEKVEDFEKMKALMNPNISEYKGDEHLEKVLNDFYQDGNFTHTNDVQIIFAPPAFFAEDIEYQLVKYKANVTFALDAKFEATPEQITQYMMTTKGADMPTFYGQDSIMSPVQHMTLFVRQPDTDDWKLVPHEFYRFPQYQRAFPDRVRKKVLNWLNK